MHDDPLLRRVEELEARLARLEAELARRTGPASRAVAPPPPTAAEEPNPPRPTMASRSPTSLGAEQAAKLADHDLERFVGLAVLGRIGIAALVLAAGYFGQLGWAHLGPAARTATIYAGGGLLVGLGFLLQASVRMQYTALLWGGGTALTWLAGVLGCLRFEVLSPTFALFAMLGSTALGQWLARLSGQQAMATVALAGAYAAPVLVGTPEPTPTRFFLLLLVLHGWSAFLERRWQWHAPRLLAVVATILLVIAWYTTNPTPTFASLAVHLELVWIGLAAPELLVALGGERVAPLRGIAIALMTFVVHLVLLAFGNAVGTGAGFPMWPALLLLVAGALLRPGDPGFGTWLARAGSALLPLAVASFVEGGGLLPAEARPGGAVLSVAVAGCVLLACRRWTDVGELGAALASLVTWAHVPHAGPRSDVPWPYLPLVLAPAVALLVLGRVAIGRVAGLVIAQLSVVTTLQPRGDLHPGGDPWSALTLASIAGLATLAVWRTARRPDPALLGVAVFSHALTLLIWVVWTITPLATVHAHDHSSTASPLWNLRTGAVLALALLAGYGFTKLPKEPELPRVVLAGTALVGLYAVGLLEVLDAAAAWSFGPRAVATSIYSLVFAGILLGVGFWRSLTPLRWAALCSFVVIVGKVLLHDLREIDTPLRVLASGVLGSVLLLAAWAYARRRRPVADAVREPPA